MRDRGFDLEHQLVTDVLGFLPSHFKLSIVVESFMGSPCSIDYGLLESVSKALML